MVANPSLYQGTNIHSIGGTTNPVVATIVSVAQSFGLDPRIAVADAIQESGLNPQAVGDNGTSFGLFQLHRGGELGGLTEQQAFDPTTNAMVALSTMASVAHAHPDWSPGQIAAAAERPADQASYAASVDQIYQSLPADLSTYQQGTGATANQNAGLLATGGSVTSPAQFVSGLGHMGEMLVGIALVFLGAYLVVKDLTNTEPIQALSGFSGAVQRRIPDARDRQAAGASEAGRANREYARRARRRTSVPGPGKGLKVTDAAGMEF